jgi:hypothetical protein
MTKLRQAGDSYEGGSRPHKNDKGGKMRTYSEWAEVAEDALFLAALVALALLWR